MNTQSPASYDLTSALERFGGDRVFLAECTDLLRAELPPLLNLLRNSIHTQAADQAHAAAHALKGMTSNFCEEGPAVTAAELAEAAREGKLAVAPALLARLERELDQLLTALGAATSGHGS